jgi:hypothetical protein
MAAQGNQANSLVFLKEYYDMDIHSQDDVNSTPLHWASYMNADIAFDYLINWQVNINAKDKDGSTPLHLAVMNGNSLIKLENLPIVRKLIRLGANLDEEDSNKRKPLDIAMNRNNQAIVEIINDNLNYGSCKFISGKAVDSNIFPITFFGFFIYNELYQFSFTLPLIESNIPILWSVFSFLTLNTLYCSLWKSDPGYRLNPGTNFKKLIESETNLNEICPACLVRTNTSYHCYYCKKCVENLDHHCIWTKNCIGKKNFKLFIIFLIVLIIKLISTILFSLLSLMSTRKSYSNILITNTIKILDIFSPKLKMIVISINIIVSVIILIPIL